jgi:hypothetical protein
MVACGGRAWCLCQWLEGPLWQWPALPPPRRCRLARRDAPGRPPLAAPLASDARDVAIMMVPATRRGRQRGPEPAGAFKIPPGPVARKHDAGGPWAARAAGSGPGLETAGAWLPPAGHGRGPLPLLARAMRLRTAIRALNVECTFTLWQCQ